MDALEARPKTDYFSVATGNTVDTARQPQSVVTGSNRKGRPDWRVDVFAIGECVGTARSYAAPKVEKPMRKMEGIISSSD